MNWRKHQLCRCNDEVKILQRSDQTYWHQYLLVPLRWGYTSSQYTVWCSLLICASTDQCWYLYGDGTLQVSILYGVVYCWMGTRFHCYLVCGLYRCVGHMTYANLMRSGYLLTYLVGKTFCSHNIIELKMTEWVERISEHLDKKHSWWSNLWWSKILDNQNS
jgi:hypothetical protein